jgi:hypothetical protein
VFSASLGSLGYSGICSHETIHHANPKASKIGASVKLEALISHDKKTCANLNENMGRVADGGHCAARVSNYRWAVHCPLCEKEIVFLFQNLCSNYVNYVEPRLAPTGTDAQHWSVGRDITGAPMMLCISGIQYSIKMLNFRFVAEQSAIGSQLSNLLEERI